MTPNYKIQKIEFFQRPNVIVVGNYPFSNLIALFNYDITPVKDNGFIGQWIVKYKNANKCT